MGGKKSIRVSPSVFPLFFPPSPLLLFSRNGANPDHCQTKVQTLSSFPSHYFSWYSKLLTNRSRKRDICLKKSGRFPRLFLAWFLFCITNESRIDSRFYYQRIFHGLFIQESRPRDPWRLRSEAIFVPWARIKVWVTTLYHVILLIATIRCQKVWHCFEFFAQATFKWMDWLEMAEAGGRKYNFKVVLLGEGCVGKTSLVLRYVENKFNDKHITTLQVKV